jgi:quercetin dioxygenase-like cupin family protein
MTLLDLPVSPASVPTAPVPTASVPTATVPPAPGSADGLAAVALALAARPRLWRPLVRFDTEDRYYTRLPARLDASIETPADGFEAWLLTWLPGQRTGWHDHGGSAGAVTVVVGELAESTLAGSEIDPVRRRRLTPGDVRPFGRNHRHEMLNASAAPAVSLHVYAPALVRMTRYRLAGARLVTTGSERAGVQW